MTNSQPNQLSASDIAQLQRRLRQYESQPNDAGELRQALIHARNLITEQEELLARLTNSATVTGLVLQVWRNPYTARTFQPGMIVRLTHDYRGLDAGEMGEITRPLDHEGDVQVDFDAVGPVWVRIAPAAQRQRELELVNGVDHDDPLVYTPGTRVRIIRGHGRGTLGTVTSSTVESDGEVAVQLDQPVPQRQRPYYYVGSPMILEPVKWQHGRALVVVDGKLIEVSNPKNVFMDAGDVVKLHSETMQIMSVVQATTLPGTIGSVLRIVDDRFAEISLNSETRLVLKTRRDLGKLEEGDRVVLDSSAAVIMKNLGSPVTGFKFSGETNVTWADIAGQVEAKQLLHEAIVLPHTSPALYKFYNQQPLMGALMYGPPGNGKTLLAKAAVSAIRQVYGGHPADTAFIYVKGPEILQMYVGMSESLVRDLFARGKRHKAQHGYPAVMFIDEAEALLGTRGTGISSDVNNTIVPQFLSEMDGLEESGVIVILATNRPDMIDPAISRDKRMDRKVYVGRPSKEIAPAYFEIHMRGMPLCNGYTLAELAALGTEELFSDKYMLYRLGTPTGEHVQFTLANLASGAMIANIVSHAKSVAMRRDLAAGTMEGVRREDIITAVHNVFVENKDMDHQSALREFAEQYLGRAAEGANLPHISAHAA